MNNSGPTGSSGRAMRARVHAALQTPSDINEPTGPRPDSDRRDAGMSVRGSARRHQQQRVQTTWSGDSGGAGDPVTTDVLIAAYNAVPTSRLTVVGVGRQGGRKPLINSIILRRAARLYIRELHRRRRARRTPTSFSPFCVRRQSSAFGTGPCFQPQMKFSLYFCDT